MASAPGSNALRSMLDEGQVRRRGRFALIGEVYSELSKVTWPPRQDVVRLSLLVLAIAAAMGVFLGLWDFAFGKLAELILLRDG